MKEAFALWLTGLPGAGKSAIARELLGKLHQRGIGAALLESDVMRTQLTPFARYDEGERHLFYSALVHLGEFLIENKLPVLFDATANRRAYRNHARERIGRFAEVYVDTPLEVCAARDPKGLYGSAREGRTSRLPGAQSPYEPPSRPELIVSGSQGDPGDAADAIIALLERHGWI